MVPYKPDDSYLAKLSGKRAMITGGLGFIGSNLARHLVKLGADVLLVDSLIPDYGGNLFNIHDIEDKVRVNIADINVYDLRAVSLRLTNTYGPGQLMKHNRQGFIGWFIRQAVN